MQQSTSKSSALLLKDRLDTVVEEYENVLIGAAYRITGDRETAKDVVQDAFLTLIESPDSFKGGSSLKTYLYRIVINRCIDLKRRKNRWGLLVDMLTQESSIGIDDKLEKAEDAAVVRGVLNAIPQKFRVPVILADVEGLSYLEIAEILKISLNTVRTRIFRCREKLRRELRKVGYVP